MSFRQGRSDEQTQGDGEGAHGDSLPWLGEKESPASAGLRAARSAFLDFRRLYPQLRKWMAPLVNGTIDPKAALARKVGFETR